MEAHVPRERCASCSYMYIYRMLIEYFCRTYIEHIRVRTGGIYRMYIECVLPPVRTRMCSIYVLHMYVYGHAAKVATFYLYSIYVCVRTGGKYICT